MSKFNSLLVLAILVCVSTSTRILKHDCHHDRIQDYIKQEVKEVGTFEENERKMASTTPRALNITTNVSYLDNLTTSTTNTTFKNNVIKAVNVATKFFNNLITIVPRTPYMVWDLSSTTCGVVTIPAADKVLGQDTDLRLYVSFTNETSSSYLAYAGWCRLVTTVGATHGLINFNLGTLASYSFSDKYQFQDLLEIVIHEMTHVLGFSSNDIQYWVNSTLGAYTYPTVTQTVRGLSTTFLRTPNVLAYAQTYYGCSTVPGMPLENQGTSGSLNSHWETTAIYGEMMNAAISSTVGSYSKFTTALLRDTGYYYSVNAAVEEPISFGKNKGCSFVTGACSTTNPEFCTSGTAQICDQNGYSVSVCTSTSFTDTGCYIPVGYSNGHCYEPNNNFQNITSYRTYLGVDFGNSARCFMSNVTNNSGVSLSTQGLCYTYSCNSASTILTVSVAGKSFSCTSDSQVITGVTGTYGKFTCPSSIANFCAQKGFCTNQCSTNGYCNNGTCICAAGYSGSDCSTVST